MKKHSATFLFLLSSPLALAGGSSQVTLRIHGQVALTCPPGSKQLLEISATEKKDLDIGCITRASDPKVISPRSAGAGQIVVTGEPGREYSIAFPPDTVELQGESGGTIRVSDFTTDAGRHPVLDSSGRGTFSVGTDVHPTVVFQALGEYSGSVTIAVSY